MNIQNTIQVIQQYTEDLEDRLVAIRRDLHQHPELSGAESWTAAYIAAALDAADVTIRTGVGGYGLVAELVTDPTRPTVALRVDMDALPIQEVNEQPYRSKVTGLMHACGHDVHSAIGIGVALILSRIRDRLAGNVRFIFQPEEEEITGALRMIRAGVLSDPEPVAIFGLHVAPIPVGQIAWTEDLFLAGFDHYLGILRVQGGTMLSLAHLDAIARRCCQVIQHFNQWHLPETFEEMQAFWKRMETSPDGLERFMIYDATQNDEVPGAWHGQFGIGIKAANHHLRRAAIGRIRASLNTICRMTHTRYRLEPMGTMPDMRNDTKLVRANIEALERIVGAESLIELKAAFPFNCEDFAYFTEYVPGAMYWLGGANPAKGKFAMLHTPDFDVDERCLKVGVRAMAALLVNTLARHDH